MERYITDERMYQAALLRIVMKMKTQPKAEFESLFKDYVKELRLDPEGFRRYVGTHMQTAMATVVKGTR